MERVQRSTLTLDTALWDGGGKVWRIRICSWEKGKTPRPLRSWAVTPSESALCAPAGLLFPRGGLHLWKERTRRGEIEKGGAVKWWQPYLCSSSKGSDKVPICPQGQVSALLRLFLFLFTKLCSLTISYRYIMKFSRFQPSLIIFCSHWNLFSAQTPSYFACCMWCASTQFKSCLHGCRLLDRERILENS